MKWREIKEERSDHQSVHPPDKLVDEVLSVSSITTFNVVVPLLLKSTEWCLKLERPQEVVGLFEVRSNGHDLVDQILHADDVVLS